MHTLLIGFGFGLLVMFGWDSGFDVDRIDRRDRNPQVLAPEPEPAPATMDGGTGIPPRP